ncbi:peptidase S10 [Prauserella marina]|uniref:Carboxypeptidase C (Cathepsin A) n=1 Tax=Prauserella marina TaxID=530584 RepID=A0A222VVV0_9PSEU|nr:peptidase S10 [Prauserella marina]ASR38035.1 peptidase S10 [Prauserella marina]PWV73271.1 carboxypeptidase C (cathepsin A) [Prauserella marina]SDD67652.1 Carboxypeptidase C (cathepsin A) [Prauserella marina]
MPETTKDETDLKAKSDEDTVADDPIDDLVTTQHSLTVKRRKLAYTAQSGRVVLRKEVLTEGKFDGHKPKAEVFITAYTLDGADPTTRPVTFAFNGGPGSSSIWLHMGVLGPRRVVSGDVNDPEPPPYRVVDNPESLLAHSDLVFIDPVSTGYSRAATGEKPKDYHGFTADIESVGEVIRLWTSRNERWLSPKFLAGESYGTLRAAALASHLQERHGLYLNGLLLISSVLDLSTVFFTEGNDTPYSLYIPTYAAIAHYHGKHGKRSLDEVLAEAEEFASRDLPWALRRGARLSATERADLVSRLATLTGLSESYVDRVNLRIEHVRFFTELLRDEGLTTGRMDGRFTTWEPDGGREHMSDDASISRIIGAYSAGFNHYVRSQLEYANDLPYEILAIDVAREWSYSDFEGRAISAVANLSSAMRANPHLKIHIALGHYDGATPYYAAEHVIAQLQLPDELRSNVETAYYPAGHMMYVHEPSRVQQSKDLAAFVRSASNR